MGKQKVQNWLRIAVVLIAAAALVGTGAVLAQISIPATEPGGEVTESRASFDSYLDAGIVIPENGLDASGEPFVIPQGIAPDDNPLEGVERTSETSATSAPTQIFHYYTVSGATLRGGLRPLSMLIPARDARTSQQEQASGGSLTPRQFYRMMPSSNSSRLLPGYKRSQWS